MSCWTFFAVTLQSLQSKNRLISKASVRVDRPSWFSAGVRAVIATDGLYACAASIADKTQQCVLLLLMHWSCCAGGDNHEEAYNAVYDDNNPPYDDDNKAKFSHEAVGGILFLQYAIC